MDRQLERAMQQRKTRQKQDLIAAFFESSAIEGHVKGNQDGRENEAVAEILPPNIKPDDDTNEYDECGGCLRLTSRPCGLCGKGRFCSPACEKHMTSIHKFHCSNGALTSADYLIADCAADELPEDPDVLEDFGFKAFITFRDRSKLLGLYIGLMHLGVTANELHQWRTSGVLAGRIVETFEKIPAGSRGGYFPWFLQHRSTIFPSHGMTEVGRNPEDILFKWARLLLEPCDRLKPISKLRPEAKKKCFLFAGMITQMTHPPPDLVGPYWDFGFCVCKGESDERLLAVLYQQLVLGKGLQPSQIYWEEMQVTTADVTCFSNFWKAFEQGSMVKLIERNGLSDQMNQIRHLRSYLNGSMEARDFCIWKLQAWLNATDMETPPNEVFIDFGFVHCGNPIVESRLKALYRQLLSRSDTIQLHEAHVAGELLSFARQYVQVDQEMADILQDCRTV